MDAADRDPLPAWPRRSTLRAWLRHALELGLERLEAEHLLAGALGCRRSALYAHPERRLSPDEEALIEDHLARRRRGEPLAYVLGHQPFRGLPIAVTSAVLIPRNDTEAIVDAALARIAGCRAPSILELGTGSGAIAVALADQCLHARIVATDLSAPALELARCNAERLVPGRIEFRRGNWYEPVVGESFDLIVSNPPYLRTEELRLAGEALAHEPPLALDGGADGLDALRAVIGGAPAHLRRGGVLLVEHGAEQGEPVRQLLCRAGLDEVTTLRDAAGRERIGLGVLTCLPGTR